MSEITITSIEFQNYKALKHYNVKLNHMNVLVGPNNSGKSTIINSFRTLACALRKTVRSPEWVNGPKGNCTGYKIPIESLPISLENIHTDYAETDTNISFKFSNQNKLNLYFPLSGDSCLLIPECEGKTPRTAGAFKKEFPFSIMVVPMLGPVLPNEKLREESTVRSDLSTHRAPRHFRSYWHHYPERFNEFAEMLSKTWPGMEIEPPQLRDIFSNELFMFCKEKRIPREIFWAGSGFQIWCQLLTHISRSSESSILVVDEPEIYLHPDVQRQLLVILREAGPDIILATHSTEIMGEADPSEILLIDKDKRVAERLKDIEGVQSAMEIIGSGQNITLTQLARYRKILYVEDENDFKILRRFARRTGLTSLASGIEITAVKSGGFSAWESIVGFASHIEKAIGGTLKVAAVFDRDYWCSEEISQIVLELNKNLKLAHVHNMKEMENYFLVPDVLERALRSEMIANSKRSGILFEEPQSMRDMLEKITEEFKNQLYSQYISKRIEYFKKTQPQLDSSTVTSQTIGLLDLMWHNLDSRLQIVPGKQMLKRLRDKLQSTYKVNLTDAKIIEEFKQSEVPSDLQELLEKLEAFRLGTY